MLRFAGCDKPMMRSARVDKTGVSRALHKVIDLSNARVVGSKARDVRGTALKACGV